VAAKLETLLAVRGGTEDDVAANVTLQGLTFAHSRPTYLDDYEAISGGESIDVYRRK